MRKILISIIIVVFLAVALGLYLTRRGRHSQSKVSTDGKTVAIVVPVTVRAIETFVNEATRVLESEHVQVLHFSAEGDPARFETVIKAAILKKPDVLILFGTQLTDTALGSQFKETLPKVVASAISSPKDLDTLVRIGLEPPRKRAVAIITDSPKEDIYSQSAEVVECLARGEKTSVGILYNESEKNSAITAAKLKQAIENEGMIVHSGIVTGPDDVLQMAKNLILKGSKVILLPHDKYVLPKASAVVKLCNEALPEGPLPVFSLDDGVVRDSGVTASVSVSYKRVGEVTATTALSILNGGDPAMIPLHVLQKASIYVNQAALNRTRSKLSEYLIREAIVVDAQQSDNQ